MTYFASLTTAELAPIMVILAGMLTGFYGLLKYILKQAEKNRESDRKERLELAQAIERMAKASEIGHERVATAVERQADESKERNGHLAEMELQSQELLKTIGDRDYKAITQVQEQHWLS